MTELDEFVFETSLDTWPATESIPRLKTAMVSAGIAADVTKELFILSLLGDTVACGPRPVRASKITVVYSSSSCGCTGGLAAECIAVA
jgi:hypothetical protein